MINYKLREDVLALNEQSYKTYGIDVLDTKTKEILKSVEDISLDKSPLEELISLCNELELDTVHLEDVIEDFLDR